MVHIISRCGANIEAISLAKEIWSFEQSRGNFLVGQTPVGSLSLSLSLCSLKNKIKKAEGFFSLLQISIQFYSKVITLKLNSLISVLWGGS